MTSEDIINRHKNKIKAQQGVDFLSKLPSYKKKTLEEKIQDNNG